MANAQRAESDSHSQHQLEKYFRLGLDGQSEKAHTYLIVAKCHMSHGSYEPRRF